MRGGRVLPAPGLAYGTDGWCRGARRLPGLSFVEFHEKTTGMKSRLWVLSTPVDGTLVEVVLVSQVREIRKPGRFVAGLGFLPMRLRHRLMNLIILREEKRFVSQDVVIWERKRYRSPGLRLVHKATREPRWKLPPG